MLVTGAVLVSLLAAACTPRLPPARPAPPAAREARAALGALEGIDDLDSLATFVAVSEQLGNHDEAAAGRQRWAARFAVERALARVGLAAEPHPALPPTPRPNHAPSQDDRLLAAAASDDRDALRRLAASRLAADHHHWPARLALLAGEELAAGRLTLPPGTLAELVFAGAPLVDRRPLALAARLIEAATAHPPAVSPTLALAWLALGADAFADARALAQEAGARAISPEAHTLAEAIAAVAGLGLGELAQFSAWAEQRDAERSPFIAGLVVEFERDDAPADLRALAARWRRAAARRGDDAPWWLRLRNAADPALPLATRRAAVAGADRHPRELNFVVRACAAAGLDQPGCLALIETAVGLDEAHLDAVADNFVALIAYDELPERWLATLVQLDAATARRLAPLERLADTRLGTTTAFAQAVVLGHLAAGDADAAERALEQRAQNLPPAWRLGARVAIGELRTSGRSFDEALAAWWAPPDVWAATPRDSEREPARTLAPALRAWAAAVGDGELAAAVQLVAPWRAGLPADERALLDEPARRLASLAHPGGPGPSLAALADAWRAAPDDDRVLTDLLSALAEQDPPTPGAALLALLTEAREVSYLAARLGEALPADPHLDATTIATWAAAVRDGARAWALGGAGAQVAPVREAALAWREEQLAGLEHVAELIRQAAETAAYLDGATLSAEERISRAWLLFLAGDGAGARRSVREDQPALAPWHPLVLLSTGREGTPPLIDDALAVDLWRAHRLGRTPPVDLALRLAALAPTAPPLRHHLCRTFVDADLTDLAFAPCSAALAAGPADEDLAAAVSWLALQRPVEATRYGLDPARLFAGGSPAVEHPEHPAWLTNRAFWLARGGRARDAAITQRRAWAAGAEHLASDLDPPTRAAFSRHLGPLNRLLPPLAPPANGGAALAQAALSALQSGEWPVARAYAAAASRWATPPSERALAATVIDLAHLAERDRRDGHLDQEGACDATQALAVGADTPALERLQRRFPAARLVRLLAADHQLANGDAAAALELLAPLVEAHPDVLLVQLQAISALESRGDHDGAAALRERAAAAHPGDERLAEAGPRPPQRAHLPAWARDGASFVRSCAAAPAPARLVRHASVEQAAELFLPSDWRPSPRLPFGFERGEAWISVAATPRASRCVGADCLNELLPELEQAGFSVAWTASDAWPAGPAAHAWLNGPGQVIWTAALPAGGRVFSLAVGGSVGALADSLAAIAVLREGFRPLDTVIGAERAELLRAARPDAPAAELRFEARRLAGAARPERCSLAPLWPRVAEASRATLLLDAYLSAPSRTAQLGLLACVGDDDPAAAVLGLPALLADDLRLHQRGRAIAALWPEEVRAAASAALLAADDAPLSARSLAQLEWLPTRGLLEVLAALPEPARGAFAGELLRSSDPAHHALVLAAGAVIDGLLPVALRDGQILTAPPALASLALFGLDGHPPPSTRAAIRARLDGLTSLADPAELALANRLAWQLAPALATEDAERLRRLAAAARALDAGDLPRRTRVDADDLDFVARAHARGLARRAKGVTAPDDELDPTLDGWLAHGERDRPSRPLTAVELTRPLGELLPGDGWTFVRLARPDLFASAARSLFARLTSTNEVDTVVARRSLEELARQNGAPLLAADSGLRLDAPIECAAPARVDRGFVCSARLADPDKVLEQFGARQAGADAAVALPLNLGTAGAALPAALSLLPALLHDTLYRPPGEPAPGRLLAERVRHATAIGGLTLSHWAVVEIDEELGASVDSEYYLVSGDHLLAFSSRELAEELLLGRVASGGSLAASRRFRALTAGWRGGGAIEAALLPDSSPLAATDTSLRLTLGATEVTVSLTYADAGRRTSVRELCDRLPPGAISRVCFSAGQVSEGGRTAFELEPPLEPLGPIPPTALLAPSRPFAFGWYALPGEPLWARWLAVLAWDDGLRARWLEEELPPPTDAAQERAEIWFALDQGQLLLASSPALLRDALPRPEVEDEPATPVLAAHLASGAAASFLHELARSLRAGDPRSELAQTWATLVGASEEVALTGTWRSRARETELRATLALRQADGQDLVLVEQWLASPLRNALRLPRRLSAAELRRPLRLVLAVPDAEAFASRSLPPSPRRRVTVGAGRVEVTIRPALELEGPAPPAPLDAAAIQRLLAAEPRLPVRSAEVQSLAARIAPGATNPAAIARAVVAWVHRELTYEITPHQPDVSHVLESRRGDCTEYSELTVTLLRALGIPAELRHGILLRGGEAVMHAWVAFHDGRAWREIEPTEGHAYVGSGHLEVSVVDFASLLSMQRLRVLALEPGE